MSLKRKCPRCEGRGVVTHPRHTSGSGNGMFGHKIRCPACRGTGKQAAK